MLAVYGSLQPVRLLEEIANWKNREQAMASLIREAIPDLEEPYANLMREWEDVFARTRACALAVLAASGGRAEPEIDPGAHAASLLSGSAGQSREFVRQLQWLEERSGAVAGAPSASALLAHARRQSEQYREENDRPEDYGGPEPADGTMRPEGSWSAGESAFVPAGGHRLPPLPYPYNALEPWIDERTMREHHDKHHQSYVNGLNKAEKKLEEARQSGNFELVKHWERELAFHGSGHYLHTIFWEAMTPRGGGEPGGALAAEINRCFGGFEAFKRHFTEAAVQVEGGGWAILVWSPRSRRLEILTAEKHQNGSQWDTVPLLPLDVWEHAYYLKHQSDRASYVRDWWNVVNWPYVSRRYSRARLLQWTPF